MVERKKGLEGVREESLRRRHLVGSGRAMGSEAGQVGWGHTAAPWVLACWRSPTQVVL